MVEGQTTYQNNEAAKSIEEQGLTLEQLRQLVQEKQQDLPPHALDMIDLSLGDYEPQLPEEYNKSQEKYISELRQSEVIRSFYERTVQRILQETTYLKPFEIAELAQWLTQRLDFQSIENGIRFSVDPDLYTLAVYRKQTREIVMQEAPSAVDLLDGIVNNSLPQIVSSTLHEVLHDLQKRETDLHDDKLGYGMAKEVHSCFAGEYRYLNIYPIKNTEQTKKSVLKNLKRIYSFEDDKLREMWLIIEGLSALGIDDREIATLVRDTDWTWDETKGFKNGKKKLIQRLQQIRKLPLFTISSITDLWNQAQDTILPSLIDEYYSRWEREQLQAQIIALEELKAVCDEFDRITEKYKSKDSDNDDHPPPPGPTGGGSESVPVRQKSGDKAKLDTDFLTTLLEQQEYDLPQNVLEETHNKQKGKEAAYYAGLTVPLNLEQIPEYDKLRTYLPTRQEVEDALYTVGRAALTGAYWTAVISGKISLTALRITGYGVHLAGSLVANVAKALWYQYVSLPEHQQREAQLQVELTQAQQEAKVAEVESGNRTALDMVRGIFGVTPVREQRATKEQQRMYRVQQDLDQHRVRHPNPAVGEAYAIQMKQRREDAEVRTQLQQEGKEPFQAEYMKTITLQVQAAAARLARGLFILPGARKNAEEEFERAVQTLQSALEWNAQWPQSSHTSHTSPAEHLGAIIQRIQTTGRDPIPAVREFDHIQRTIEQIHQQITQAEEMIHQALQDSSLSEADKQHLQTVLAQQRQDRRAVKEHIQHKFSAIQDVHRLARTIGQILRTSMNHFTQRTSYVEQYIEQMRTPTIHQDTVPETQPAEEHIAAEEITSPSTVEDVQPPIIEHEEKRPETPVHPIVSTEQEERPSTPEEQQGTQQEIIQLTEEEKRKEEERKAAARQKHEEDIAAVRRMLLKYITGQRTITGEQIAEQDATIHGAGSIRTVRREEKKAAAQTLDQNSSKDNTASSTPAPKNLPQQPPVRRPFPSLPGLVSGAA